MHPGDLLGHVIDLGVEPLTSQLPSQLSSPLMKTEKIDKTINNINKISIKKEKDHQLYQQVCLIKKT